MQNDVISKHLYKVTEVMWIFFKIMWKKYELFVHEIFWVSLP